MGVEMVGRESVREMTMDGVRGKRVGERDRETLRNSLSVRRRRR